MYTKCTYPCMARPYFIQEHYCFHYVYVSSLFAYGTILKVIIVPLHENRVWQCKTTHNAPTYIIVHARVCNSTHYTSAENVAMCQRAHGRLMTYKLLVSNLNTCCVHNLLATWVHLTHGIHEMFIYIKLLHMYLPSNVISKSHFLKIVLICICAILFLLVNAYHVCTWF